MNKDQMAVKILSRLESQRFADWYNNGKFDSYIRVDYPKGDPKHVTREMILEDIKQMFLADM